jgi:phosphatidylserine/phosphatidylglycerophosphate/cardiolipin synthase-like enzyme
MESPFSNYTDTVTGFNEINYNVGGELESKSPFDNSAHTGCNCSGSNKEMQELYAGEALSFTDIMPVANETTFFPEMETELSAPQLTNAMQLNAAFMASLKWVNHLDAIIALLKNKTGIDAKPGGTIQHDILAKAIDKYQELKNLKPTDKGVIAIGTWSVIQDDLGFLQYTKPVKIDITKARSSNRKYEKELWGTNVNAIMAYLASKGITRHALPLDAGYFALVIAKWQESKFPNKKDVDGVLGPNSWQLMKADMSATPPVTVSRSRWHKVVPGAVLCNAEPLMDGTETFAKMVEAIRSVKKGGFIYILGWMFDVDFPLIYNKPETSLHNLLQEATTTKQAEVRILSWKNPWYTHKVFQAFLKINQMTNARFFIDDITFGSPEARATIGKIKSLISQIPDVVANRLNGVVDWNEIIALTNLPNEGSHHEKVMIIQQEEGVTAFCGGVDINPDRFHELHDVHCRVTGHAAMELLNRFIERWKTYTLAKGMAGSPYVALTASAQQTAPPPPATGTGASYVKILHTYNRWDGTKKDRSIRNTLKEVIKNAQRYIWMEDQYMVSCEIAGWLNEKLRSNPEFKVTILTQNDVYAKSDMKIPKRKRAEFIRKLTYAIPTPANVQVLELRPIHPPAFHHKVHSKIYIVDNELAIVGSANCNRRSMFNDSETAAFIFNDETPGYSFAAQLTDKIIKYHPQQNTIQKYGPNSAIDDLDVSLLKTLAKVSSVVGIIPGASVIVQNLMAAVPSLVNSLWELIDPNPDNITCTIPGTTDSEYTQLEEGETLWQGPVHEANPLLSWSAMNIANEAVSPEPAVFAQGENYGNHFPDKQIAEMIEQQVAITTNTIAPVKPCEGHTCWAKNALNQEMGVTLVVNNQLDESTKKTIAAFQSKTGLPQTQKIDPVTERALLEAEAIRQHKGTVKETAAVNIITTAKTRIEDFTAKAVVDKNEITSNYRDPRKLWAFVLHQMAFKRRGPVSKQYSDPLGYLKTGAHFCIMLDGRIIQLHAFSRFIWHAQCISPRSVAVEFEGNFPNISGRWWIDKDSTVQNKDQPTAAQFDAGRFLASYLKIVLGTTHILAHRQSSDTRENDPGPDIWYNVGQWAIDNLGMTDGGATFKCGTGNPILAQWRTWGNKTTVTPGKEYDDQYEMTDLEQDETEPEYADMETTEEYDDEYTGYET